MSEIVLKDSEQNKPKKRSEVLYILIIAVLGVIIFVLLATKIKVNLVYLIVTSLTLIIIAYLYSKKRGLVKVGGWEVVQDIKKQHWKKYKDFVLNDSPTNVKFRYLGNIMHVEFLKEGIYFQYDTLLKQIVAQDHLSLSQEMKNIEKSEILKALTKEDIKKDSFRDLLEERGYLQP